MAVTGGKDRRGGGRRGDRKGIVGKRTARLDFRNGYAMLSVSIHRQTEKFASQRASVD